MFLLKMLLYSIKIKAKITFKKKAEVVLPYRPQSGHIRPCGIFTIRPYPPGKTAIFPKFPHFFQIRTYQSVSTAYGGPIYQIKAGEMLYSTQK